MRKHWTPERNGFTDIDTFFDRHPEFNPRKDKLLNTRSSQRWFDILQKGVEEDLYIFQRPFHSKPGPQVNIEGKTFHVLSSYDYLGLIGHAAIEEAAMDAIREFGTGTGGVRLLTGTNALHEELESMLSEFIGLPSSMVFTSGYLANLAAIASLFDPRDCVLADEFVHRSLLDALKLAGIPRKTFRHNDMNDLEAQLSALDRNHKKQRTILLVEGIYSMDGDICPLREVLDLKERYGAFLLVDEAHSLGVLGKTGRGIAEHFGVDPNRIDLITGSLSKAIPSNGGFIASREGVIHFLKHGGAPFMFSSSLSPANAKAATAAFHVILGESWRIETLWSTTRAFLKSLRGLEIPIGNSTGPIIPILCGENQKAFELSKHLYDKGYLANAIIYPAVPENFARLRLCVTAPMNPLHLQRFAEDLASVL